MQRKFEATIVWLVLNGQPEEALKILSRYYDVDTPRLKVGLPKGHKLKIAACYSSKNKTISVLNSDTLREPFVILHEFYHHLRTNIVAQHLGTEKNANRFADKYIQAYTSFVSLLQDREMIK